MKPTVFNYQEYEKVVEENKKLKAEVANLQIRCRIAESEKHGELISRADAIEAIASRDETDGTVKVFTGRQVNEILESLPSADRPTGEWVDDCTCSICHWMHEDNNGFALITKYNYCPNCGARMYKGGEEE